MTKPAWEKLRDILIEGFSASPSRCWHNEGETKDIIETKRIENLNHLEGIVEEIKSLFASELQAVLGEEREESKIAGCDICGKEGYHKLWYGHGKETHDLWGDRYVPTGSLVVCKNCFKDYHIGIEYDGEEIWRQTSDLPEHSARRISEITIQLKENKGYNAHREACLKKAKERNINLK